MNAEKQCFSLKYSFYRPSDSASRGGRTTPSLPPPSYNPSYTLEKTMSASWIQTTTDNRRCSSEMLSWSVIYTRFLSLSGSANPNIQLQLSVPKTIATIQNVSLINKDGNELKQLKYNTESDLPEIDITEHQLSTEPVYLRLIASTDDGKCPYVRTSCTKTSIHNMAYVF